MPALPRLHFKAAGHNSEYAFSDAAAVADSLTKLKDLRAEVKAQRHAAQVEKALVKERQALKNLRAGVQHYLVQVAAMGAEGSWVALRKAKQFRAARRFARRVLAQPKARPDWLLTARPEPVEADWAEGGFYQEASEAEKYEAALLRLQAAEKHRASFKPRKSWSRHAGEECDRRDLVIKREEITLERILEDALKRQLAVLFGEHCAEAADSYSRWRECYGNTRRQLRKWPERKVELVLAYRRALEPRKAVQSKGGRR